MTKHRHAPFPKWLDRVREADSRRHAKMTPEERVADIHQGAQEAWKLLETKPAKPPRGRRPHAA